MIICASCGKENADHYRFCLGCGAELSQNEAELPEPVSTGGEAVSGNAPSTHRSRQAALDAFATNPGGGGSAFSEAIKAEREAELREAQAELAELQRVAASATLNELPPTPPALDEFLDEQPPTPISEVEPISEATDSHLDESPESIEVDQGEQIVDGFDEVADSLGVAFSEPLPDSSEFAAESMAEVEAPPAAIIEEAASSEFGESFSLDPISPEPAVEEPAPSVSSPEEAEKPRICAQCQTIVPPGFSFCGACGARYEGEPSISVTVSAAEIEAAAQQEVSNRYALSLTYIHPDGSEGQVITANEQYLEIGRESPWSVFQRDEFLSKRQVGFHFRDQQLFIEDLGGVNGVFLRLRASHQLEHGDYFRAGQQLFRFERLREFKGSPDPDGTRKLGAPLYGAWGRLGHIVGQGEVGQAWLLYEPDVKLGRAKGDIVFSNDRFMSSQHCGLRCQDDEVELYDQGSTNGTYRRINESSALLDGDLVLLGQQVFRVSFEITA
ncbi:MAG: FHA domain-containing protein [Myxococcota bacterium]|nr:FHA domain-containing protein [Myxococcota bacterium]